MAVSDITTTTGTSKVKVVKDGVEKEHEFTYSTPVAGSLEDVKEIEAKNVDPENKNSSYHTWESILLMRYNQVVESNARQAARAAFISVLDGPDKQISVIAKKMAALLSITEVDAEKMVRAQMKAAGKLA